MKKIRCSKNERGQAIAELTAGLIGICFVIIGLLMIAMLGITGVRNVIQARSLADHYSASGQVTGSPRHITSWTDPDGLPFTADDTPQTQSFPNAVTFTEELTDNTGMFQTAMLADTSYAQEALESRFVESNLFVSAANLTAGEVRVTDPLSQYKNFDAKRILSRLGLTSDFSIVDTVYMPMRNTD